MIILLLCIAAFMLSPRLQAFQEQGIRFDIPAQPMGPALLRYSEQARVQLILAVDPNMLPDSAGVTGRFAADEALGRLIAGADLEYFFTSANTVTIRRRQGAPHSANPPL